MTFAKAEARHKKLVADILNYDRAYGEGRPLIPDPEYDNLEKELLRLEEEHPKLKTTDSPSQHVRADPLVGFQRVKHLAPMLSLEKIQSVDEPTRTEEPDDDRRKQLQDENTLVGISGPSAFSEENKREKKSKVAIKDLLKVADQLRQRPDPVSTFLWQTLAAQDQLLLEDYQALPPNSNQAQLAQDVIVRLLDSIINGPCVYEKERFRGVSLRPETGDLIRQNPKGSRMAHVNRMLLEDAYPVLPKMPSAGLVNFDATLKKQLGREKIDYLLEPKVDGVSISVHYRHGKLTLGVTRGDGREGDDITANLKTVKSIPHELNLKNPPALLEVRGEAYIPQTEFEAMNQHLEAVGEKPFPNARNATAGTLKQLDSNLVVRRPIAAVFYAVGACEGIHFDTHAEVLESLKKFGLPTQPQWWVCHGIAEVLKCYREKVVAHYDAKHDLRSKLPYEIDGVVLKVNTLDDWTRIPAKSKSPGYAIVHKPIPWITPAETVLKDITVQVGRTGVLTPVAELEPVFVQGSTVARATLHNEDEIQAKDIRISDTVIVRKAGMVIPEVMEVVMAKRPPGAKPFDLVAHIGGKCPACGGPIARETVSSGNKQEVAWRCQNIAGCPAQKTRRVEFFAQRKALDIESLGGIVAEKLVERGMVNEPLDLFGLTIEKLGKLNLGTEDEPRTYGEKNATKAIEALERAKQLPLNRWIYALAIPEAGETTAYQLALTHESLEDLAKSQLLKDIAELGELENERKRITPQSRKNPPKTEAERQEREAQNEKLKVKIQEIESRIGDDSGKSLMPEVGWVAAKSVLDFFASESGRTVLKRLAALHIHPKSDAIKAAAANAAASPLAGKTLMVTGTLATMSRDEAFEKIRAAGGNVSNSISSKTSFLVAGESAGSKLEKAQGLGVKVLTERQFLDLIGSL